LNFWWICIEFNAVLSSSLPQLMKIVIKQMAPSR